MWLSFTFGHCLGRILGHKTFIRNEFKGWHIFGLFTSSGEVTVIWAKGVDCVLHLLFICGYSLFVFGYSCLMSGLIHGNSLIMFFFGLFLSSLVKCNCLFMPGLSICLVLLYGFLMLGLSFCLSFKPLFWYKSSIGDVFEYRANRLFSFFQWHKTFIIFKFECFTLQIFFLMV